MDAAKTGMGLVANAYPHLRQVYQETGEEKEFRAANKFPEIESSMPMLKSRRRASLIDVFTSWLGLLNPHSHSVDDQHVVWLFDNTAYRSTGASDQDWETEWVVAYFIKDSGQDASVVAADIAEKLGFGRGDAQESTIAERLKPLMDTILPAHTVKIQLADGEGPIHQLGPSDRNGISSQAIRFQSQHQNGDSAVFDAVGIKSFTPCRTTFAGPTGWAVISDIDDTIKVTLTASPLGILRTTFAEPFTPIEGMPELYKHIRQALGDPPFWYLSASPYNLYPFLREFREQYYPPGPLLLRDASWMNLGGFLASLTQGTQAYKVDRMVKLHARFPRRKYICIGDTTQSDPEAYAEVYRKFPGWVRGIFIRKVTGVAEMDSCKKNSDSRIEKAFEGIPKSVWAIFDNAEEVQARIDDLVAAIQD